MLNGSQFDSISKRCFNIQKISFLKHPEQRHLKTSDEAAAYTRLRNEHGGQKHVW